MQKNQNLKKTRLQSVLPLFLMRFFKWNFFETTYILCIHYTNPQIRTMQKMRINPIAKVSRWIIVSCGNQSLRMIFLVIQLFSVGYTNVPKARSEFLKNTINYQRWLGHVYTSKRYRSVWCAWCATRLKTEMISISALIDIVFSHKAVIMTS